MNKKIIALLLVVVGGLIVFQFKKPKSLLGSKSSSAKVKEGTKSPMVATEDKVIKVEGKDPFIIKKGCVQAIKRNPPDPFFMNAADPIEYTIKPTYESANSVVAVKLKSGQVLKVTRGTCEWWTRYEIAGKFSVKNAIPSMIDVLSRPIFAGKMVEYLQVHLIPKLKKIDLEKVNFEQGNLFECHPSQQCMIYPARTKVEIYIGPMPGKNFKPMKVKS